LLDSIWAPTRRFVSLRGLPGAAAAAVLLLWAAGCGGGEPTRTKADRPAVEAGETLFTKLPAAYTNVDFTNRLTYTEDTNVFTYRNYHNGGGVAIGDLNGDGRQDLYFTANQEDNRLYLNRGDWWFEDVTDAAGVAGTRAWSTGVAVADVNGDGRLDIYVCNSGEISGDDRRNELFINQGTDENGVPQFEERAAAYGLDHPGYSTHATFLDYDKDGDLDLYLLNNAFTPISEFDLRTNRRGERDALGGDKLFRNDGGTFTDVTEQAGIYESEIAFGLGVSVGDVNRDGWPDLYVSNDFFERDYLYLNNRDGTFREVLPRQMPTTSLSSMGADIADFTNDGRPEIFVTDMLPDRDDRLKTTMTFEPWSTYRTKVRNGYHHQLQRNTLHLNNGNGTFSEIAPLADVHATDWSWGALGADFNLDGRVDLFVSNGVYKDVTDQDFIAELTTRETAQRMMERGRAEFLNLIEKIPSERLPNYAFRNTDSLRFENAAAEWGLDAPSFSNGAAYGDLDNDGDLDLAVNNLGHESFVYRNEATTATENRYLQVRLEGTPPNTDGLGAQLTVEDDGTTYYREQYPMRGFQSASGTRLTVGVGTADTVDAVTVAWPDGRVTRRTDVATDRTLVARQAEAAPADTTGPTPRPRPPGDNPPSRDGPFTDVTDEVGLRHTHEENDFSDFQREPLLPRKLSTQGPRLAVGDVNGDGRDDVYVGGAKGQPGTLYTQRADGAFAPTNEALFARDATSEDVGALFFDATGNGALDLYVVSGGYAFSDTAPALQDRLYVNDGTGSFERSRERLPRLRQSGGPVTAIDYDRDGDRDLFVGGRVVPWAYGRTPESYVFENDGTGHFTDVTDEVAPGLGEIGMVTDAAWTDVLGDAREELVVVGDWMPITIFRTTDGTLRRVDADGLDESRGWWTRLLAEDVTGDGRTDLVVGNFGRNMRLETSPERPVTMYVGDFNQNGRSATLLSHVVDGREVPFSLRGPLVREFGFARRRFPSHEAYADATIDDLLSEDQRARATTQQVHTFRSVVVENRGDGTFAMRPLPARAQFAPMFGLYAGDLTADGATDLVMAGNFHGAPPRLGRMAASYGALLRGTGDGAFTAVPPRKSGLLVRDQVRDVAALNTVRHGRVLVFAKNDAPLQIVAPPSPRRPSLRSTRSSE
jgi:hypothetical protein